MEISGKVIKYGDNVNTDLIIPGKFLVLTDPKALARHAMEGLDSEFLQKLKDRKIVVAGKNFGSGSSREQAPLALKYAGVRCVLADSFARIFYRNAINIGLPVLECEGISGTVKDGDKVQIDLGTGVIEDLTLGVKLPTVPTPEFLMEIMKIGLIEYIKKRRRRM